MFDLCPQVLFINQKSPSTTYKSSNNEDKSYAPPDGEQDSKEDEDTKDNSLEAVTCARPLSAAVCNHAVKRFGVGVNCLRTFKFDIDHLEGDIKIISGK